MSKPRKFRDIKATCKEVVEEYRKKYGDDRSRPEFHIGCVSTYAGSGFIQLMRQAKGEEQPVYSEPVAYSSITELAFIMENLGKAWDRTNP